MNVLVTGGGGFLGQAIIRRLISRGASVRSLSRGDYPELRALGVTCVSGDLADSDAVNRAVSGCDTVFHVAAKAGVWGRYSDYYRVNVNGTENVIAACLQAGVSRLIYTSSPSVVFDGHNEAGIDESTPYPRRYLASYPKTKAIAERLILKANRRLTAKGEPLATISLRPHLIWGPGDNHLFPRLLDRARKGRLRQVGSGKNRVDAVYIDNAADAHLCAADALDPTSEISGRPYFISNGEPLPLWDLINQMLACAGVSPITRKIPGSAAYLIGAALEVLYTVLRREEEPPMTRFVARQLSTDHWFKIDAARQAFNYRPEVSVEEGLKRLKASLNS